MKKIILLITLPQIVFAQNYDSYFTGNATDIITQPHGGVCLMGGATEDDNAMTWFLEQANGGDVLVLRASGSDGYNDYFYTELGVPVNSVESIVFNDATASSETYIHQKIDQAEAIWFAGGDQWNYVSYWRDTAIDSLINKAIAERNIVIGGTSAGMAILGSVYFTAENGTVTSAQALNNPFATGVTIDNAPFLEIPYMTDVITDTHYDNPDRRGRHFVFMTRKFVDMGGHIYGIACEEYVAVCVDTLGIARVYGGYPAYDEQAYFIRMNCGYYDAIYPPEVCTAGTPLTWSANEDILVAYKVNGTSTGSNYFDLNTWQTGNGGSWEYWYAEAGVFGNTAEPDYECILSVEEQPIYTPALSVFPNPAELNLMVLSKDKMLIEEIYISDITGRIFQKMPVQASEILIETNRLQPGVYFLNYSVAGVWDVIRFEVK
jgi:cyanophycinase-like exopeptidase